MLKLSQDSVLQDPSQGGVPLKMKATLTKMEVVSLLEGAATG